MQVQIGDTVYTVSIIKGQPVFGESAPAEPETEQTMAQAQRYRITPQGEGAILEIEASPLDNLVKIEKPQGVNKPSFEKSTPKSRTAPLPTTLGGVEG